MGKIFCLGVTPALQRTLLFTRLQSNAVNRACEVHLSPAGKSVNTAYALVRLGCEAVTSGFNGGGTGAEVVRLLEEAGVESRLTPISGATRICSTLLDRSTGSVTELVEEAPPVSGAECARFQGEALSLIRQASALVISGTLPKFLPVDFYVPFILAARERDLPLLIDSHGAALLAALPAAPLIVKMNFQELQTSCGRSPLSSESETLRALYDLQGRGAQNLLVTQGGETAYLLERGGGWRFTPPRLEGVLNPIGSGDSVSAGLMARLLAGDSLREAVRFGLACGAANAETLLPAHFKAERAEELVSCIDVSRL